MVRFLFGMAPHRDWIGVSRPRKYLGGGVGYGDRLIIPFPLSGFLGGFPDEGEGYS